MSTWISNRNTRKTQPYIEHRGWASRRAISDPSRDVIDIRDSRRDQYEAYGSASGFHAARNDFERRSTGVIEDMDLENEESGVEDVFKRYDRMAGGENHLINQEELCSGEDVAMVAPVDPNENENMMAVTAIPVSTQRIEFFRLVEDMKTGIHNKSEVVLQ
jgi:hypothetical protein